MFSSRLLAALAVLVTVAAYPATDKPIEKPVEDPITTLYEEDFDSPWFSFPLFGNLFAPIWNLFPNFSEIGPTINTDDNKFQVVINVKDYKKEDVKVKVKGNLLFIQGIREMSKDKHDVFASQFFHTYSLPANCSAADVTAELTSDSKLIVTAPIGDAPVENTEDREVPIVETGKPYSKEETTEKPAAPIEPEESKSEEDDRKEPTTPSTKEDVSEKDNSIPHGN